MGSSYYRDTHRTELIRRGNAAKDGCFVEYVATSRGGRLHVTCGTANPDFTAGAKELGGVWRRRSMYWTFRVTNLPLIMDLCASNYPAVYFSKDFNSYVRGINLDTPRRHVDREYGMSILRKIREEGETE